MSAVMAMEPSVAVERQGNVAVPAPSRQSAGTTVDRRSHSPPVEQQNRLAASFGQAPELGQERRRERIAALPPQVDDPDTRHRSADPRRENDPSRASPSSPAAAWRSRTPPPHLRALRASPQPSERRTGDRTPACTRSRAPRRRSRARDCASGRRPPSARLRRHGPRRGRPDRARRGAPPDRAPSGESPPCRRSARGSARRSAVRARSRARARSCRGLAPSAASHACRYTSVLPLPVGPTRRRWAPLLSPSPATTRSTAVLCSVVNAAGLGSPGSDSRSAGDGRSPRGARRTGATSSSARAGVVP